MLVYEGNGIMVQLLVVVSFTSVLCHYSGSLGQIQLVKRLILSIIFGFKFLSFYGMIDLDQVCCIHLYVGIHNKDQWEGKRGKLTTLNERSALSQWWSRSQEEAATTSSRRRCCASGPYFRAGSQFIFLSIYLYNFILNEGVAQNFLM